MCNNQLKWVMVVWLLWLKSITDYFKSTMMRPTIIICHKESSSMKIKCAVQEDVLLL